MKMKKRMKIYEAPILVVYQVATERGFAQSLGGGLTDYAPGEDDSLDD